MTPGHQNCLGELFANPQLPSILTFVESAQLLSSSHQRLTDSHYKLRESIFKETAENSFDCL